MRTLPLVTILCLITFGCASAGSKSADPTRPRFEFNVLSGDQIRAADRPDVLEAIKRLRPTFLSRAGRGAPTVFLDGVPLPGIDELRYIPIDVIGEVRYVRPIDAFTRHGSIAADGAILVSTRATTRQH